MDGFICRHREAIEARGLSPLPTESRGLPPLTTESRGLTPLDGGAEAQMARTMRSLGYGWEIESSHCPTRSQQLQL